MPPRPPHQVKAGNRRECRGMFTTKQRIVRPNAMNATEYYYAGFCSAGLQDDWAVLSEHQLMLLGDENEMTEKTGQVYHAVYNLRPGSVYAVHRYRDLFSLTSHYT